MDALIRSFIDYLPVVGAVGAGIGLLYHAFFLLLPQLAAARYGKTDPDRLRRCLEFVVAAPSVFGGSAKLSARLMLAELYLRKGQHAEAANHCREAVATLAGMKRYRYGHNSLEAVFRHRLADSLDAFGLADAAAAERCRAEELVERAPADALRNHTRGKLLQRQDRHAEAYAEFVRALERTPAARTVARVECMVQLAIAANRAGQPADCLRWAEEAIAQGARDSFLRIAHRMAALACGSLSRLDDAEQHLRRAHDLAAAAGDRPAAAETLAQLAGCLRKRGRLAAAADACARAAALDPKAERQALAVQTRVFVNLGRYDDALAAIRRFRKVEPMVIPYHERQVRAGSALEAARIEARCGRVDDAWRHLQEARAEFETDAKMSFQCDAVLAVVHAARGDAAESQRLAAALELRLADFERDPGACRSVLYNLGMAAAARGDHPAGVRCWTAFLALSPDPVNYPDALYYRGECHRSLGRHDDARADFQAAVATDIDSHCAGLARRRLSELLLL